MKYLVGFSGVGLVALITLYFNDDTIFEFQFLPSNRENDKRNEFNRTKAEPVEETFDHNYTDLEKLTQINSPYQLGAETTKSPAGKKLTLTSGCIQPLADFTCYVGNSKSMTEESASFGLYSREEMLKLYENGTMIYATRGQPMGKPGWFGRLSNHLVEVSHAMAYAAMCGKVIALPNNQGAMYSEIVESFNCFDGRNIFDIELDFQSKICDNIQQSHKSMRGWFRAHFEKVEKISSKNARMAHTAFGISNKVILNYMGIYRGMSNCVPCSVERKHKTIAWLRSGDIMGKGFVAPGYGQPPLDYYVQAIKATGAEEVKVITQDLLTPLARALEQYPFENVNITLAVGEPWKDVFRQLFCAKNLIIGKTSWQRLMGFSPNIDSLYSPWGRECQCPGKGENCFAYKTNSTYTPEKKWKNGKRQREEMLTYKDGNIVKCNQTYQEVR